VRRRRGIGESGYVLGALVGDAGDAVVVDEKGWGVGGVVGREGRVGDGSVGDAAYGGEKIAAAALDLFRSGAGAADDVPGYTNQGGSADRDGGDSSQGAKGERQMSWIERKHRCLPKSGESRRGACSKKVFINSYQTLICQ
jgi:hypothetical protein